MRKFTALIFNDLIIHVLKKQHPNEFLVDVFNNLIVHLKVKATPRKKLVYHHSFPMRHAVLLFFFHENFKSNTI